MRPYTISLDLDEVEYIQNALQEYMELQSERAKEDTTEQLQTVEGDTLVIDLSDMFVAQYVDTKALRRRFVDLVGRDLTSLGQ